MNSLSPGTTTAPGPPVGLDLLDALRAVGDEVPPDAARPVHGLASQQRQTGPLGRDRRDRVARPEHEALAGRKHGCAPWTSTASEWTISVKGGSCERWQ